MITSIRCGDEILRDELLDRVRRVERSAGDLFREVLSAPAAQLPEYEAQVRHLEGEYG